MQCTSMILFSCIFRPSSELWREVSQLPLEHNAWCGKGTQQDEVLKGVSVLGIHCNQTKETLGRMP